MANGYMPRQDMEAFNWMNTFAGGITSSPSVYQIAAPVIAQLNDAVDAYRDAYKTAIDPATRTAGAVSAKDDARRNAEAVIRPIYLQIKMDSSIANDDKINIGVRPVNSARSRIPTPDSRPSLSVRDKGHGEHLIKYSDTDSSFRIAKPREAIGLQVYRYIGNAKPSSLDQMQYFKTFTRQINKINYSENDDLKMATYMARWINRKGETGPWSNPVTLRITSQVPEFKTALAA